MGNEPLPVIFRYDRKHEEVIALFPTLIGTNEYDCTGYIHVGQHTTMDPILVVSRTRPATPEEYGPLLAELTGPVGYENLVVVRRIHPSYREARRREAAVMMAEYAAERANRGHEGEP